MDTSSQDVCSHSREDDQPDGIFSVLRPDWLISSTMGPSAVSAAEYELRHSGKNTRAGTARLPHKVSHCKDLPHLYPQKSNPRFSSSCSTAFFKGNCYHLTYQRKRLKIGDWSLRNMRFCISSVAILVCLSSFFFFSFLFFLSVCFFLLFSTDWNALHTLSGIAKECLWKRRGMPLACLGCGVRILTRNSSFHLFADRPCRRRATSIATSSIIITEAPPAAPSAASSSPSSALLVGLNHVVEWHIQDTRHGSDHRLDLSCLDTRNSLPPRQAK